MLVSRKVSRQERQPGATIHTMHSNSKVISRLRLALAFGLSLWCAGAGCMMVSYAHAAAIVNSEIPDSKFAQTGVGDASGSMGSHACCKARHSASKQDGNSSGKSTDSFSQAVTGFQVALPLEPASSDAVSCCPLTSGSFVVQSRSASGDEGSSLSTSDALTSILTSSGSAFRAIPLRLAVKTRTYLSCCALLI